MADPLFLSLWLDGYHAMGLPVYFQKALEVFPFSKLAPGGTLRVYPFSFQEAPQIERLIEDIIDPREVSTLAQEFLHEDVAFQLETKWDLYQWDGDWALKPSRILIECYGPRFETDQGEHLRVDAGSELLFLPNPKSDQWRPVQSNIRSLLHLAADLENALPVAKRQLWSENDENFAERLQGMMS